MRKAFLRGALAALCFAAMLPAGAAGAQPEPIRVMLIDPLSGPQGLIGTRASRGLQHLFGRENAAGGSSAVRSNSSPATAGSPSATRATAWTARSPPASGSWPRASARTSR
jgi:hypothetical protein